MIDTGAGCDPRITVCTVSPMRSRTTTKDSVSSLTGTRIELLLFALITALISGSLWLILASLGGDVKEEGSIAIFAVATSGPSLAALALYLTRTRRAKNSAPRQRISTPWKWGPVSLVLGAVPALAAYLLFAPQDLTPRITAVPDVVASFGGTAMFLLLFMIAGPLAEEFGWRGYAQPRLRRSFGLLTTSAVIGVVWWAWHIPLFFLPGTGQATMGFLTFESLSFALSFVPLSLIYLYVTERLGGGVWAAVLLHFSINTAGTLLPDESGAAGVARLAVICLMAAIVYFTWPPAASGPLGTGPVRSSRVLPR